MNRSTILILVLSSWVLAACGGSSFSVEDPHHEDDHAEHDDHDDDHGHDHDDDHGHGHEEEMYEQLQGWLDMRDAFDPMPEPPADMMESVGTPVTASWSGDIDGTINPLYPDYTDPEIELILDEHADMHGNVYVHTPDSDDHKLVHHLDAENVTGSSFASPADDENRMTGTFYGDDHGTIVGTVNTAIVIGTYQAEKNGDDH